MRRLVIGVLAVVASLCTATAANAWSQALGETKHYATHTKPCYVYAENGDMFYAVCVDFRKDTVEDICSVAGRRGLGCNLWWSNDRGFKVVVWRGL